MSDVKTDAAPISPPAAAPVSDPTLAAKAALKKPGTLWRIGLILAGIVVLLCFFLPQFYCRFTLTISMFGQTESKTETWMFWGWSTWWGILSFIFAFLVTAAAVLDLLISASVPIIRDVMRFVYVGIWGLLTVTTGLGILLALFGVGTSSQDLKKSEAVLKMFDTQTSYWRIPVMAIPLMLATLVATGLAVMILMKELKKPAATTTNSMASSSPSVSA